jgi:hypothetical protein
MAKQSHYSIEIKDDTGKEVIFAAKWTVDERRRAVAKMRRLVERKPSSTKPQGNRAASLAETWTLPRNRRHLKGHTATLKRCTPIVRDVDGCLAPPIDLPPWQLAAGIANRPKLPRIRQSLHRCRVMLRVNALVEPIVFHPGVFARFLKRHRAVASAYRAAEGLRSVIDVAQFAEMQPGVAPADVTPDPQGPEDLAKRAEAKGYATEGIDHAARLEAAAGRGRINFFACSADSW